jgi:amino acid transporter
MDEAHFSDNPLVRLFSGARRPPAVAAPPPEAPAASDALDADAAALAGMGYKQELARGMSAFMSFAFTLTAVGVLPSISTGWGTAMATGGPSVILYGWLICGLFTTLTGCAMAEVNARYPSAGSVYYWSAMLAPRRHAALAAYVCGVLNLAGNAAGGAAFALGFANFVATALSLRGWQDGVGAPEGAGLSRGAITAIAMLVCVVWAAVNALRVDQQGWLNNLAAGWQVSATVIIVAVILAVPGRDPAVPGDWVWRTPFSATGFEGGSQYSGYVYLLGLLNALFAFSGYDAGTHMAEETRDASAASSWGIVYCCLLTFVVGLVYNLGMLYATPSVVLMSHAAWALGGGVGGDDDPYVASGDVSVQAYLRHAMLLTSKGGSILVFFSACGAVAGAALAALLIVSSFFTGAASLTATSRIIYAMARDNALPGSGALTYIWPATATPMGTVTAALAIDCLLLLLGLASTQGLTAVLSIAVIGFQLSYALPLLLRITTARAEFRAHPDFDLGAASLPVHCVAVAWLLFTSLILLWPTAWPVTPGTANYTVLVVAVVAALGAAYWVAEARRSFVGPRELAESAAAEAQAEASRKAESLELGASEAAALRPAPPRVRGEAEEEQAVEEWSSRG